MAARRCVWVVGSTVTATLALAGCELGISPVGYPVAAVALGAGDVDLDGDLDLVAGEANAFTIMVNDGLGGLTAGPTMPLGFAPADIDVAELTGDGTPDIAFVNAAIESADAGLYVAPGNGEGGFAPPEGRLWPSSSWFEDAAVDDLNRDGRADITVIGSDSTPERIEVRLGQPDGEFDQPIYSNLLDGFSATVLDFEDMDDDGHPDAVIGGDYTGNPGQEPPSAALMSLLGSSTGRFDRPKGPAITHVGGAVCDLVADGPDISSADYWGQVVSVSDRAELFTQEVSSTGEFAGRQASTRLAQAACSDRLSDALAPATIESAANGQVDLVASPGRLGASASEHAPEVRFPDGTLTYNAVHGLNGGGVADVVEDLDGDGLDDVVVRRESDIVVFLNRLDGRRNH